jgi:hypothetical protein
MLIRIRATRPAKADTFVVGLAPGRRWSGAEIERPSASPFDFKRGSRRA